MKNTVNDIYKMFEDGITLESGVHLTRKDLWELERIYRISYGINSYEFIKENVEETDVKMEDVIDHDLDFYEGIYNAIQDIITGDDEYDVVMREVRKENK